MFSRNLNIIKGFLDNIEATVKNPDRVEVLIKLDEDQPEAKLFIEDQVTKKSFVIKYLITPRLNGLTSLWLASNELFLLSSPDSYFLQAISDEVRFETMHWDDILEKYIGFFPDHIFRLRMSTFKLNAYPTPFICNLTPDSFPIQTRQWVTLTMGFGSCCWATDIYHQFVAYYLSLGEQAYKYFKTPFYDKGIFRDVPLLDIKFSGLEFGMGVSSEMMKNRELWMIEGWNRNLSHYRQENFSYLAKRISSYIWAVENKIEKFTIMRNSLKKSVQIIDETGKLRREISYQLPRIDFFMANMIRKIRFSRVKFGWWCEQHFAAVRNIILGRLNIILEKFFPYKEDGRLLKFLLRQRLPKNVKSLCAQLLVIDQQISIKQLGRIQKTTKMITITLRAIINYYLDRIEKFMVGSPPGLANRKKFLKIISSPKWPKDPIATPPEDMEWALDTFRNQEEIYKKMEATEQQPKQLNSFDQTNLQEILKN